jgi:hypothetical protein
MATEPRGLAAATVGPPADGRLSIRHLTLVGLVFGAVSLVYTYPLVLDLGALGMVGGGDLYGALGRIGAVARQFLTDPRGLFDTHFFYPYSNTHAYWAPFWLAGLLAAPGLALTGQLLLVTNLLILGAFVASGVLAYAGVWHLTGQVGPSLIAGLLFAFYPNRIDHFGQFGVQMGILLPLVFWAFYRFYLERRWTDLLVVVVGLAAQTLLSIYAAYALGFLLATFFLVLLVLRPRLCTAPLLLKGAAAVVLLGALLAPFLRPYFAVHRELGMERDIRLLEVASMDLLALFDGGSFNALYRNWPTRTGGVEGGLFPGVVALALATGAPWLTGRAGGGTAGTVWRRRARWGVAIAALACLALIVATPWSGGLRLSVGGVRLLRVVRLTTPLLLLLVLLLAWVALEGRQSSRGPLSPREWAVGLICLAAVTYALTLSPNLTVWRRVWGHAPAWWIYHYLPGGRGFGATGRWAPAFILVLATLAGLGAWAAARCVRGPASRWIIWLLVALVMVELRPRPLPLDRLPDPAPVYRWLAEQPGDTAVLELPVGNGRLQSLYMYQASVHGKRLVNGELSFVPPFFNELAELTRPLDVPALVEAIRSVYPLGHLVVHGATGDEDDLADRDRLRANAGPALRFVRTLDEDDVYALVPTPHAGVDVRRYFSLDVLQRRPVAAFTLRLPGEDAEVTRRVEIRFNDRPLRTLEAPLSATLRLEPPFRQADRNSLAFVHRYEVRREVRATDAYRIGRTGRFAPVDIQAVSAGRNVGNDVSVKINGLEMVTLFRRGYNLVALEPESGRLLGSENFDTFLAAEESARMARFVDALPDGAVVVAAVKHDGGGALTEAGVRALRAIGAKEDLRGTLWRSHLVVGVKGAAPGQAWEAAGLERLRVSIGRERPLVLSLDDFALRGPDGR